MKALQRLTSAAARSLLKLTQKKHRRESGKFLIEGPHLVEEALVSGAPLEMLLVTEEAAAKPECASLLGKAGSMRIPLYAVAQRELERIADAVTSQGILAIALAAKPVLGDFWLRQRRNSLLVALEHVADPGNAGTILRTCDWFGVDGVLLSCGCVELHNPKVVRSTMGALFHLPVFEELDLPATLTEAKGSGYHIAVTALAGGRPFDRAGLPEKSVIVFGSEGAGVSAEVLACGDSVVTIPRFGSGESLNVGSACAAILGSLRLP